MSVLFKPIAIDTSSGDQEAQLVLNDSRLIAVIVKLSSEHGDLSGRWFVEKGFGRLNGPSHPTFADLKAAEVWFDRRVPARR